MIKKQDKKNQNESKPTTTGHSWDGVEEYNTPAPRWWLIVWVICIIWAIIYWFFYPTWPIPGGNNKGIKNWTSKSELKESEIEINKKQSFYLQEFSKLNFEQIKNDKQLMEFSLNGGKAAFQNNCAVCHGTGAGGQKGYPNLNDDDWLWGGKIEDIYTTVKYGIRSTHEKTKSNMMPAFGKQKILTASEIEKVASYVLSLSEAKENQNDQSQVAFGKMIFKDQCSACHTINATGDKSQGAPNLTDKIWLYGGKKEDVIYTITNARNGVMPTWEGRLDEQTIRQLALYIHSLGGGE